MADFAEIGGRRVAISHPDKVVFPAAGGREPVTKLDLITYYLAVADGALRGVADRPMILKRFVKGITEEAIFQKRAPEKRPDWIDVAELRYARGTSAKEAVLHDAAGLVWAVNLGCVDLNPHPVRSGDLDHPDELRIDLDPMPGVAWPQIVDVAQVAREVLEDHGLTAWPKTSGSRGFHIYARIAPRWPFKQVRLAAETVAREVARRAPELATSQWWKEERQGVFVDFNQNAKDRTVASAYSVRATPDARVSTPLTWDEVPGCRAEEFTIATVPSRVADVGDPWAPMDDAVGSLDALLRLAEELGPAEKAPKGGKPLIEIARTKTRDEAMAALDVWRARHPEAARVLHPTDILVDGMRGPSSIWYRIRINLEHVPEAARPAQEELLADYSPWEGYSGRQGRP
ncbi:DNA polymerase domain-containing protein [Mycobacterium sp. CVI_P3]|uniref:DNA polymerase domain-containing protein n=1 Tax=Mycobacterium pinniadriaticum TaxID=2994102 RepID=A0ABT3SIL5_9MYCO|nr:DNA polymerase domain-containing protein [Mycobacterium pinniadriaticum]MCX2932592.1 DNA polymerase domain-containing protein [Mycobacterium pinniadriaticum]MCX2938964.1 DNA polymerase domain-containing protein [Mycobacterium pinniadriaticum]